MRKILACFGLIALIANPLSAEEDFLLVDGRSAEVIQEFGNHIDERVTPASTFKIVLSLIGYDAGILKDETTPVWDFREGYEDFLQTWRSPQNPRTWISQSCIWFSKIITMELGLETFQSYLALFNYGNQNLSVGIVEPGPLNPAWASSSLNISPKEQVNFIRKMVLGALPVSKHAFEMTKSILFQGECDGGWKLYARTGTGILPENDGESLRLRWCVGWIEKEQDFFVFAYQIRAKDIDVSQTYPRVKHLLYRK